MAQSTFSPILREVIHATLSGLPCPRCPSSEAGHAAVARGFMDRLGCRIRRVAGAIDGCLIPISTPPAIYKADFNIRNCFYGINLSAIVDANKRFL